ncbi:penicillin-binding transpeptidase domain-containing protein [Chitinispirillales bacterium ANBcel5]|uniref:penicillin-binding transpeptidase domain-containing protein n=1 Tax=Cellulosispirillum alkaliphilum TaxID=3039283 RepID=UPI002A58706C|nr:penicillin-binding transpeptidase domain-containing protein [Chitinispirillales bacterium ANBcel5]
MTQFKLRLIFVCLIFLAIGIVMVSRLFAIQIIDGERYALRSRSQAKQRKMVSPRRGSIKDRYGRILATSQQVAIDGSIWGGEGRSGERTLNRIYPGGDLAGPLLGHVGRDGYGLAGIEFTLDHHLRGEKGWAIIHRDGHNRAYKKIGLPQQEPINGSDVYLTIDIDIQRIAQSVLRQAVSELDAKGGKVIIMEPRTGKVLAMVNEPSFNPNVPSQYSVSDRQNRTISTIYEPGSTFKVVTAAAALQEKVATPKDTINANQGVYRVYNQVIRDIVPRGEITFTEAISFSSNVAMAKIADELGNERLFNYVRDFGLGKKTGIELPGEENGILHPVRNWSGRTRVTMAMGHEISATFLQMMLPFASIANGGVLVSPLIYEKVQAPRGSVVESARVKPVRRVINEQVSQQLRYILRDAVENGTGRRAAVPGVSVAGKTGTSQKPDSGRYSETRFWSSFIGFMPSEDPVLLCGILIDEPAGGETGGLAAAPVFSKIMTQILSHSRLEYARKILNDQPRLHTNSERSLRIADFRGEEVGKIKAKINPDIFSLTVIGDGDVVKYQSPAAGSLIKRGGDVVLYTESELYGSEQTFSIPDCTGKELRDAFNLLNLKGLNPYIVGSGRVKRQVPAPGSIVAIDTPCTLFSYLGNDVHRN